MKTKSVFTFQPSKLLVSTNVKGAKSAVMCLMLHSRNKSQHFLYLLEMVHIVLQKRRVATTNSKNHLFFEETSPPITIFLNWQTFSIYESNLLSSLWLRKWAKFLTSDSSHTFLFHIQAAWSSHLPKKVSSGLLILVQTPLFWL